jgi:RNA polymerase sigma factor (sigma-70 family)
VTSDPDELPKRRHGQPHPAAPREILRAAYRTVFTWFRRRVPDEHAAHDLTQITFLRFRSWQNNKPGLLPENLEAFLLQQAEWVRRDYFRKMVKTREVETLIGNNLDLAVLEDGKLLASLPTMTPLSAIPGSVDLKSAVASLSDTKRLALVLRFVDDLATPQIAEVLKLTPRRVNQLINEALDELVSSKRLAGYSTPRGGHR